MDEQTEGRPGVFVPENVRRVIRAFGDEMHLHLGGEQTGGRFTLWTNVTPPGGGPPPHRHLHEDELFLPLSGRVSFFYEDAWREVAAGTTVFMPRGTVHTFKNVGDTPLRMLIQTMPGGFDAFFEKCAEVFAAAGPPDMERIIQVSAAHGIYFAER